MYKLIIVDDEILIRNFLKEIIPIISSEWTVVGTASDGLEALELLKTIQIDLVITDIKMPELDGLQLCKQIKEIYPHIHRVILSGYGEFEYAKKALKYDVNNYLLKPIINEELKDMLTSLAKLCEKEENQLHKYTDLIQTSDKYIEEITTKLLKAIITQNHIEIDTFYPILTDLDTSLFNNNTVIIIFRISEDLLINNDISFSRLASLKLLLFNTIKTKTKNTSIKTFNDLDDNVILCVPIDETSNLTKVSQEIYNDINSTFFGKTKVSVFCAVGSKENDLLKLNRSYELAKTALTQSLFNKSSNPLIIASTKDLFNKKIESLNSYINSIMYTICNKDLFQLQEISKELSNFLVKNIPLEKSINFFCIFINYLQKHINSKDDSAQEAYNLLIDSKNSLNDKCYFSNLIIKITNCFITNTSNNNLQCTTNHLIEETKQFIYNHYMETISLSLIAETLSVTPSYLSNLFHQSEGESYIKFLTQVRLKHAETLLKSENITLEAITSQVGYLSVKHFSSVFKKYYEMSPGKYRKKHNKFY